MLHLINIAIRLALYLQEMSIRDINAMWQFIGFTLKSPVAPDTHEKYKTTETLQHELHMFVRPNNNPIKHTQMLLRPC